MLGFDLEGAISINRYKKDFEELNLIGSGGFSSVYKVRNKHDKRQYALKIIKIKPSQYKKDVSDYLEKVLGEVRLLSSLHHSCVLQYHGCWIDGDSFTEEDFQPIEENVSDQSEIEMYIEQSQSSFGIAFEPQSNSVEQKKEIELQVSKNSSQTQNLLSNKLLRHKQIRIFILSELGKTSLQKYIVQRNKNLSRDYDKASQKYTGITNSEKQFLKSQQEQRVANQKRMKIENYRFIIDIIEGLTYLHDQKIIHRDIKLQNIILDKKMRCKIIDFGLAKRVRAMKSLQLDRWFSQEAKSQYQEEYYEYDYTDSDTNQIEKQKHSMRVGTKIFSSPQQSSSDTYDYRTDIFSLAMAIALMFSCPSTVHQERELLHQIRNKNLEKVNIDSKLKSLLSKCLGEQKDRPELSELKHCVKTLLAIEIMNTENCIPNKNNISAYKNSKRIPLSESLGIKSQSSNKLQIQNYKSQISVKN